MEYINELNNKLLLRLISIGDYLKYVLNLSIKEDILSDYFSKNSKYRICTLKKPIFEKIYKTSYPNKTKKSFDNAEIILCNCTTFEDINYFNDFYCTSSYMLFPEILRFIGNISPKIFLIIDVSEYLQSRHYEEFKFWITSLKYNMINIPIIINGLEFILLIGIINEINANLPSTPSIIKENDIHSFLDEYLSKINNQENKE